MVIRPNHKARHDRAHRANIDIPSIGDTFRRFKWFTIALIVLFPIYPSLSLLGSGATVRANDYDESTIITAYSDLGDTTGDGYISDAGLIRIDGGSSGRSDIPPIVPIGSGTSVQSVKKHTVKPLESIRSISDKYDISTDAILWANDLSMDDELKVGQILKIPPVSGVVHTVVDGDTISEIARRYSVVGSDIVSVNKLRDAGSIRIGMDLMIPGAIRRTPTSADTTPQNTPPKTPINRGATTVIRDSSDAKIDTDTPSKISSTTGLKDRYLVKYTGKSRGFVGGNCTWYVAQNKTVTWRGNASSWMRNARADGVKTGSKPVVGAIVQFSGAGYNRYYGHVGIVAGIEGDDIIVKDMNYRGLYEVTIRKVPMDHPAIDGYIYVD